MKKRVCVDLTDLKGLDGLFQYCSMSGEVLDKQGVYSNVYLHSLGRKVKVKVDRIQEDDGEAEPKRKWREEDTIQVFRENAWWDANIVGELEEGSFNWLVKWKGKYVGVPDEEVIDGKLIRENKREYF